MDGAERLARFGEDQIILDYGQKGTIAMRDNSLSATMQGSELRVITPRVPGITIELVDHTKDSLAPEGAVYRINAYNPSDNSRIDGNPIYVYIGAKGIILGESDKSRLVEDELFRRNKSACSY